MYSTSQTFGHTFPFPSMRKCVQTVDWCCNCHCLAYNQYTSARIVFYLNLMSWRYSFDAFLVTQMRWICDKNGVKRAQWKNWLPLCVVPVHAHIHETLSTILVEFDCLIKTVKLRIYEISSSAPNWLNVTQRVVWTWNLISTALSIH